MNKNSNASPRAPISILMGESLIGDHADSSNIISVAHGLNGAHNDAAKTVVQNESQNTASCSHVDRCTCQVKADIIQAATERFVHYGYGKTTIADIAADCKMSSGNIYRYFESKLDIASIISHDVGVQVMAELGKKAGQMAKARDRLRVFLFDSLRQTFRELDKKPRLAEMIAHVRKERPEIRRKIRKMERRILADILKYGRKTGEFRFDCTSSAARIIQCLVGRFRWPQMKARDADLVRLETELEGTFVMISAALDAGCAVGSVMQDHPKDKDQDEDEVSEMAS